MLGMRSSLLGMHSSMMGLHSLMLGMRSSVPRPSMALGKSVAIHGTANYFALPPIAGLRDIQRLTQ